MRPKSSTGTDASTCAPRPEAADTTCSRATAPPVPSRIRRATWGATSTARCSSTTTASGTSTTPTTAAYAGASCPHTSPSATMLTSAAASQANGPKGLASSSATISSISSTPETMSGRMVIASTTPCPAQGRSPASIRKASRTRFSLTQRRLPTRPWATAQLSSAQTSTPISSATTTCRTTRPDAS